MVGTKPHGQAWLVAAHPRQALQNPGEARTIYKSKTNCKVPVYCNSEPVSSRAADKKNTRLGATQAHLAMP